MRPFGRPWTGARPAHVVHLGSALVLLVGASSPAAGQLPSASAAAGGTAGSYRALARGVSAVSLNPAALALPGTPSFSLGLPVARVETGLDPVTLGDLEAFEGRTVPDAERERWLSEIAAAGGETGAGAGDASLSATVGRFGFQLGTVAGVRAVLNEDAAELLLFGNAGRTGAPGDFDLQDSRARAFLASTAAVSAALPVEGLRPAGETLAVGVTLKYTVGHFLALATDRGSRLSSDPVAVDLRFPVVQTDTALDGIDAGSGVGMDVAVAWQTGPWSLALVLENAFHTFAWNREDLRFRPGEAVFDADRSESDFDARPLSEAPEDLVAEIEGLDFPPTVALGAAVRAARRLRVVGELEHRFREGLETDPRTRVGAGLEYTPTPWLPLRAGVAAVSDGYRIGGGAGLSLGPVDLAVSAQRQGGGAGDATILEAGLVFSAR